MYLFKYCQLTSRRIWSFGKLAGTQAMCEKLGGESVSFGKIENANWGRRSLLQLSPPKSGLMDVLPHFKENAHFVRKLQRKNTIRCIFSRNTKRRGTKWPIFPHGRLFWEKIAQIWKHKSRIKLAKNCSRLVIWKVRDANSYPSRQKALQR